MTTLASRLTKRYPSRMLRETIHGGNDNHKKRRQKEGSSEERTCMSKSRRALGHIVTTDLLDVVESSCGEGRRHFTVPIEGTCSLQPVTCLSSVCTNTMLPFFACIILVHASFTLVCPHSPQARFLLAPSLLLPFTQTYLIRPSIHPSIHLHSSF